MQIAFVSTKGPSMRHEINGWTFEDSDLLVRRSSRDRPDRIFIGHTPSPRIPFYGTILEMLADEWALLAPPADETWTNEDGVKIPQWGWWLTRTAALASKAGER